MQQLVVGLLQGDGSDFFAQLIVIQLTTNVHYASVHARTDEIGSMPFIRQEIKPQHDQYAAGHVLSQEMLCRSPDHDDRPLVLVFLHMNRHAIADVVPNKDLATPHRVACGVSCSPVDNDLAAVHRVATPVLGIAVYDDVRTVHERCQVISRGAMDVDLDGMVQICAQVALAIDVVQLDVFYAAFHGLAQFCV